MTKLNDDLNFVNKLGEIEEKKRQERIKEWTNPDITLEAIKDNRNTIGLWKVNDGVVEIEANVRGEFDPYKSKFFNEEIILALYNCSMGKRK